MMVDSGLGVAKTMRSDRVADEASDLSDESSTQMISAQEKRALGGSARPEEFPEGSSIGNYVVEKVIGGGGGGTVYAARHRVLGRRVAIKVLRNEMAAFPAMVARFVREAAAVNQVRHPNIVDIYEFGEISPGRPFYVMEVLEGMDLWKLLRLHGRFSAVEMLDYIEPVCGAVQAAHDVGIVHRDLKASNVVVVERNGRQEVKLLDFGIAKMLHGESGNQGLTEPGSMVGSAHNMAPEQIRCERVDSRADIYALGVLIFQLLTGRYPFEADDPMKIAVLHLQAPAPRPSAFAAVTPAMDAVVVRCLEKLPSRRFASANELVLALREVVGERGGGGREASAPAIGVYFEIQTAEDAEMDDEMIEDISNVLDMVERSLAESAFALPLRTSTSLLGVRLIDGDADEESEKRAAEATVEALEVELAERPGRHPGVEVAISLTLGKALCRPSESGVEIVGGPLLEVATWTHQGRG
jgi:serine/threonine-protein kinase